jgi:hypothetical protein
LTAITLPLSRFPGQTMKRELYFGGLKTAQPLVLLVSLLLAWYVLAFSATSYPIWLMTIGFAPLILASVSYFYYVARSHFSGKTLLDASLGELRRLFGRERVYFHRVSLLGTFMVVVSMGVTLSRYHSTGEITPLSVSLISVIAFQVYIQSVVRGLFSKTDIVAYCGLTVLFEVTALLLLDLGYEPFLLILALSIIVWLLLSERALRDLSLNAFLQRTVG